MQAVQIGGGGIYTDQPATDQPGTDPVGDMISNMSDSQFISAFFYGRSPAERLLTGLQIVAALFTIFLAIRLIFKNS